MIHIKPQALLEENLRFLINTAALRDIRPNSIGNPDLRWGKVLPPLLIQV